MSRLLLFFTFLLGLTFTIDAQPDRWQQRAEYVMDIDFDVSNHQFSGTQELTYFNNSPDTLHKVFYHLYFNAFQPNSMMDVRSRTIGDPDRRVQDRISKLKENEIGYLRVDYLSQDGKATKYEEVGTILEVTLANPILPGTKTIFKMGFKAQVPVQIRRSGRDNREGISYSMSQWYPKLAEYDYQGWHANPYIAREFHGIWGDFDVTISIDRSYMVAATGYLQNPQEIGMGYEDENKRLKVQKGEKLAWQFKGTNIIDFVWAADPDYKHTTLTRDNGNVLHFFYQPGERTNENWEKLPMIMDEAFNYINEHFGQYEYKKYSFIQAGDGGMEYPMATLITGNRSLGSLVGVSVHELLHSWYQMMLGINESLYSWMDEGFTSYATNRVMNHLRSKGLIPGTVVDNPHARSYSGYMNLARTEYEEAMITHADHYVRNAAYGTAAYAKGAVFLHQLDYVIGKEAFDKGILDFYNAWKFKHPNDNDCIRIFEKASGLELDWYREYFVNTTHTVDYGIRRVEESEGKTTVTLERIGLMPMPIDLYVTMKDGTQKVYNIPLRVMRGEKAQDGTQALEVLEDWPWTHPTYTTTLDIPQGQIQKIEIDPTKRLADIDGKNNVLDLN
ncbi:MAG: M1 family metallopeptidase [Bacteroidota bacterium]